MAAQFEVTDQYDAIRLSYVDLETLIERVREYVRKANQGSPDVKYTVETFKINQGSAGITLGDGFDIADLRLAPEVADSFHYMFRARDNAPISSVVIWMSDSRREVEIEGSSRNAVHDLKAILEAVIRNHRVPYSGDRIRTALGLSLWVISFAIFAYLGVVALATRQLPPGTRVLSPIAFGCQALTWIPWRRVLPGVSVLRGETAWYRRYTAEISLIGTILGIVALVLTVIAWPSVAPTGASTSPPQPPAQDAKP